MVFKLHPQLKRDTLVVGDLKLCRVLLMNNRNFPWLILVPKKSSLKEIFDLAPNDYKIAMEEVRQTAKAFAKFTRAGKMNIANLGNIVPQLHIHIIARYKSDIAWPKPVWSAPVESETYPQADAGKILEKLRETLPHVKITKM